MHRTGKKRKEKKEKRKEKEKKKKETQTHCKLIHWLHGTGSSMPAVSCGSKGVVGCMPTTGCVQKLWEGLVSNAHNVGASSRCCQDLVMAWQLDLLARQV